MNKTLPGWRDYANQFIAVINHKGINVHEPVANVFKAISVDLFGLNPLSLRILSLIIHFLNSLLLYILLQKIIENTFLSLKSVRPNPLLLLMVCSLFLVHPLNMEVIGWLSAQNYLFSLTFSLFSMYCFEVYWHQQILNGESQQSLVLVLLLLLSWLSYILGTLVR
jgi:hypothetical protein